MACGMMMVVVFVVVEVDDSAFGSDGEEIGGGCHGGSDGSILVVEAFDASSASDVPSVNITITSTAHDIFSIGSERNGSHTTVHFQVSNPLS